MAYVGYSKVQALVVDDFDSFRMTVTKMLQELGIQSIDTAVNGVEALRQCRQKHFDLVLCDHNLGRGKTGQQVLEELRYYKILKPSAVFILISAESSRSIVMAAYDYEPDDYLTKPITSRSLQRRLERLMMRSARLAPICEAMEQGRNEEAIALCRKEIKSGGRYAARCQKLLAELYLNTGELELSETLYRHVLDQRPLDWAMLGMAKIKYAQKDTLSAQQWLEDTLQEHPLCMAAYDLKAKICREQGAQDRLQSVLQEAVEVSPLAIQRQQNLADAALANSDLITAAQAYRKAVRLGENSVHDRAEAHMNLARATASLFQEDKQLAKSLARDALKALNEYAHRFKTTPESKTESLLIEAQITAGQGDKRSSEKMLQEAQNLLTEEAVVLSLDASLELAKTFRALGKADAAQRLLNDLVDQYGGNQEQLEKIDRWLESPASQKNRKLMAELNKKGIGYYEQKQYREAVDCFEHALRKFPRHIGVRLNLAQALLDQMSEDGPDEIRLAEVTTNLAFVAEAITPSHEQFRRFRQLQDLEKQTERKLKK